MCHVMHHVKFTAIHQTFTNIPSHLVNDDYWMIIYAANNSQLMIYSNTMQKGRKQYLIGQNIRECMNLIRCYYFDCIQYIVYD